MLYDFLKFFSSCFFGRPDQHATRSDDLNVMVKYFMSKSTNVNINVPVFFWMHLLEIARNAMSVTQDIVVGGLITRLVLKCNVNIPDEVSNDCLLTMQHLTQCGYIVEGSAGSHRWKIYPQPYQYIVLPTDKLPPLAPNLPH